MTSSPRLTGARGWRECLTVLSAVAVFWPCRVALGWGREGHAVIALVAEHYMSKAALANASNLLDGSTIEAVASWADDYRREHHETGPWHYIDIPCRFEN